MTPAIAVTAGDPALVLAHFGPASGVALLAAAGVALVVLLSPGGRSRRGALALGGLVAAAVALSPPVEHAAEHGVAPHMVQHMLLISVAAPLIALAPHSPPGLVPLPARRRLGRATLLARRAAPHLLVTTTLAHAWAVAFWHVPGPYDAAVRSPVLHAVEHVTMLGTGVAMWAAVRLNVRRNPLGSIASLFVTAVVGAGIGALLTFAPEPMYQLSVAAPDPLADQQLAGLLMWVPGGMVPVVGAALVLRRAVMERVAPADRPPVPRAALVGEMR